MKIGILVLMMIFYLSPVSAGGPKKAETRAPSEEEATVWVMAQDGSVSCGPQYAGGLPMETLEKAADRVREAKIKVFDSKKIQNPQTQMLTVCGQPTRDYNAILISKKSLKEALLQGFQPAPADWIK